MGIADLRNAFITELPPGWQVTDCELHTVPNSGNQQQVIISGFDPSGKPFTQNSAPFPPSENPTAKARDMARGLLNSAQNPMQPPLAAVVTSAPVKKAAMAPLIEIKGLSTTINAAKKGISDLRSAATSFQSESSALTSELNDLTAQIKQHRDDLQFEAETLGNSAQSSTSQGS